MSALVSRVNRALEALPSAGHSSLRVEWHDHWDADLARAYHAVAGDSWMPRDVFVALLGAGSRVPKRVAVVVLNDAVSAIVPIACRGEYWEPLTAGVIPGLRPAPGGSVTLRALLAMGRALHLREMRSAPPAARWATRLPYYELALDRPPEEYWREAGRMKSLRHARNRGSRLSFDRATAGEARWLLESWHDHWGRLRPGGESARWEDRAVALEGMRAHGLADAWLLRAGDDPAAAMSGFARDGVLHLGTVFRDRSFDRLSAGTRLFDAVITLAYEEGYRAVSLGTSHAYKRWWAPQAGWRYHYGISPAHVYTFQRAAWAAANVRPWRRA